MSARKYDFLTRFCFLIAILSSMMYGKLGAFNWLALSIGVASAVVAVVPYFCNVHLEDKAEAGAVREVAFVADGPVHESGTTDLVVSALDIGVPRLTRSGEVQTTLWENLLTVPAEDHYLLLEYNHEVSRQTAQLRERQLFLDEIVQLVDRYSPTCEVEVSLADGHLTIRPARPGRPVHIKTREERQDIDFEVAQRAATPRMIN